MKVNITGVIVVEGAMDVAFLSNFIESEFVSVNGSAVDPKTVEYLQNLPNTTPIYLLLDPDSPGEKIRHHLHQKLNHYIDVFIPQASAIKGKKVGVAESDATTILDAFQKGLTQAACEKEPVITMNDLMTLGLLGQPSSTIKREKIASIFHLGHTNGKTFLTRLNRRNINVQQIKELLNEKTS